MPEAAPLTYRQAVTESASVLLLPENPTAEEAWVEAKHEALGEILGYLFDGEDTPQPCTAARLQWLLYDLAYTMHEPALPKPE